MAAPLTPLCSPVVAARLAGPACLADEILLRSYRSDEWKRWFEAAGTACPPLHGPLFDSSTTMAVAAMSGVGIALAPAAMFAKELGAERLVCPFEVEVDTGRYWLTRLHSREETATMRAFSAWLLGQAGATDRS
jgi:LysR family transcriptional regulator of beta-lactamase